MREPRIHLHPRLELAAELMGHAHTIGDVGCDHGRFSIALLQRGQAEHAIATDISEGPLSRAAELCRICGMEERMTLRLGDGLLPIAPYEAEAIAILGMGGTLMARLLSEVTPPIRGAKRLILQPMRGIEDIRSYLCENRYHIMEDRIVEDAGRLYQVFSCCKADTPDPLPEGWPADCYALGYRALLDGDPLFPALAEQMLAQHEKRLTTAKGSEGGALLTKKAEQMRTVLALYKTLHPPKGD